MVIAPGRPESLINLISKRRRSFVGCMPANHKSTRKFARGSKSAVNHICCEYGHGCAHEINNFLLPDRDPQSAGPYRKGMQVPNYSARELVHSSIAWTSMDCSLTGLLPRYVHWTDSGVAGPILLPHLVRMYSEYPRIPICSAHGCGICNSVVCSGWGLVSLRVAPSSRQRADIREALVFLGKLHD